MITVPQAVEKIVKRSRYLTEALSKDLINASSLARYIQPEVEELVFKKVTLGSIIVAVKRLSNNYSSTYPPVTIFKVPPDLIIRSNLALIYIKNSDQTLEKLLNIEEESLNIQKKALFTYGRVETTILTNRINLRMIQELMKGEEITKFFDNVSSITIHLPKDAVANSGIIYFFLKSLAWEDVNILDILSTETELTLVFSSEDIKTAFGIIQSLFQKNY